MMGGGIVFHIVDSGVEQPHAQSCHTAARSAEAGEQIALALLLIFLFFFFRELLFARGHAFGFGFLRRQPLHDAERGRGIVPSLHRHIEAERIGRIFLVLVHLRCQNILAQVRSRCFAVRVSWS